MSDSLIQVSLKVKRPTFPLNGDQVAAAVASRFLAIMVVRMVTSRLVMHAGLVHRKLTRMGRVIQRAAKREIGSLTVWKDLVPNRTYRGLHKD